MGRWGRAKVRNETRGRSGGSRLTHDEELEDHSEPWGLVLKGESGLGGPKPRPPLTSVEKQVLSRARSWS